MEATSPISRPRVLSLHIIYDADGTMAGEFVYIAKKMLGLAHCAACDITHGPRKEKPEFTKIKSSWKVPLYNIHRDEMDIRMAHATHGSLPCVVARTEQYDTVVLDSASLEACHGDVYRFQTVLDYALKHAQFEIQTSATPQFCPLPLAHCAVPVDRHGVGLGRNDIRSYAMDTRCDDVESEAVVPSL
ncbi:unnamed protein product [Agarophyton chilense]|eukprot:gb/GEZJ01001658.1/.p1 GENE.gb/GEZJ01001658.1/~~gb/GEZJ01001658.1/.p1  ORF type:complete len:188 (-),score=21.47 gb/GEZJ01001658.1/:621-1184(-)